MEQSSNTIPRDLDEQIADAKARAADADRLRAAADAADLAHGKAEAALADARVDPVEVARVNAAIEQADTDYNRLSRQAETVGRVPCGGRVVTVGDGMEDCATCELLQDAITARELLPEVRDRMRALEAEAATLAEALAHETALKARAAAALRDASEMDRAASDAEAAADRLDVLKGLAATRDKADAIRDQLAEARGVVATTEGGLAALRVELADLEDAAPDDTAEDLRAQMEAARGAGARLAVLRDERARLAEELATAEARLEDCQARRETADARHWAARDVLYQLMEDADALDGPAAEAAAHLSTLEARAAGLRGRAQELRTRAEPLAGLEALLADARQLHADERLIERGMGVDGVQGLMVDMAGPRFSERMNELLAIFAGDAEPWQVAFRTYDPDAPPSRREKAEILVKAPGDADFRPPRVSPGQRRPLQIAMRGAALLTVEESLGVAFPFAVADELDTGLNPEAQRALVDMLRAAGRRLWLVISHSVEVQEAADVHVRVDDSVEGGVVRVRG